MVTTIILLYRKSHLPSGLVGFKSSTLMQNHTPCASFHAENTVPYHHSSEDGFTPSAIRSSLKPRISPPFRTLQSSLQLLVSLWANVHFLLSLLELTPPSWSPASTQCKVKHVPCVSVGRMVLVWSDLFSRMRSSWERERGWPRALYIVDNTEYLVWIARQWFFYDTLDKEEFMT